MRVSHHKIPYPIPSLTCRDKLQCNCPSRNKLQCNCPSRDKLQCNCPSRNKLQCNCPSRDKKQCNYPSQAQVHTSTNGWRSRPTVDIQALRVSLHKIPFPFPFPLPLSPLLSTLAYAFNHLTVALTLFSAAFAAAPVELDVKRSKANP